MARQRREQIAAAFLAEDESQLEYYEAITNRMPGKVLRRHGVVERNGDCYRLASNVVGLSPSETTHSLPCVIRPSRSSKRLEGRRSGSIAQSASVKFRASSDTRLALKRAGFRCELCALYT